MEQYQTKEKQITSQDLNQREPLKMQSKNQSGSREPVPLLLQKVRAAVGRYAL